MSEYFDLLILACDLVFVLVWTASFKRVVPRFGIRRFAGIGGWLLALAGYFQISTNISVRRSASYIFDNAWSLPISSGEKFAVLTVAASVLLIAIANRGSLRRKIVES